MPAFGIMETARIARDFPICIDNCQTFAVEHRYFDEHPKLEAFYRALMPWERDEDTLAQEKQATGVHVQRFSDGEIHRTYCEVVVVDGDDSESVEPAEETPSSDISYTQEDIDEFLAEMGEEEEHYRIPLLLRFVGSVPLLDLPPCATLEDVAEYEESVYERFPDWEGFFRVLAPCEHTDGSKPVLQGANAAFICREFGGFVRHYVCFPWLEEKGTNNG